MIKMVPSTLALLPLDVYPGILSQLFALKEN